MVDGEGNPRSVEWWESRPTPENRTFKCTKIVKTVHLSVPRGTLHKKP